MQVNIFTDASVNPTTGDGGFAFYIGCRIGKIQKAGKAKIKTKSPNLAELNCIGNAIYTLTRSKLNNLDKVNVYSDSEVCINILNNTSKSNKQSQVYRDISEEIKFLCMEFCLRQGLSIRDYKKVFNFQHVKAHTGGQDKHSLINRWCDIEARKYMKKK